MTKADLIESMATKVDLPKGQAERAINTIFEDIVSALRNGDKVNISGFGTFAVSARKARAGRFSNRPERCQCVTMSGASGGTAAAWKAAGTASAGGVAIFFG